MPVENVPMFFRKGPWHHQQMQREGNVALYRRWKMYDGVEGAVHYEVVRLVSRAETVLPSGVLIAPYEQYPPSSQWGTRGWTFPTLPEAEAKYTALLAQRTAHA